MFKTLRDEIESIRRRDPAARSAMEVVLCYPGLHAVIGYRMASRLWRWRLYLAARFLSHLTKIFTGVEIHPAARIGKRLFIDHATNVVIGETAEIGDDVTLYQGVTLGGTSLNKGKRHPTVEDGAIIGSGAQVLGPVTIGREARIGANAVVLSDVPPGVTMVGIPARMVMRKREEATEFCAYGTPAEGMPDPVARAIDSMRGQIGELMERLERLEGGRVGSGCATAARKPHVVSDSDSDGDDEDSQAAAGGGSKR